ncbi:hypothetical protein HDU81_011091, partial [Chytriomyces hyalinus]
MKQMTCSCCQRHTLAIAALQQQMLNEVNSLRRLLQMPPCACCQSHELTIQALKQQMLDDANSYRKLLQMPLLTSIESPLLTLSKTPPSITAHPSIDIVPSVPPVPSKGTLEFMPPEVLDRIVSFVRGADIIQLCHAVPYYKYISKAIYDFGYPIRTRYEQRDVWSNFWPGVKMRQTAHTRAAMLPVPVPHLHELQIYSAILSKHSGYASIDDSTGITVLGALPDNVHVLVNHTMPSTGMDEFFAALYNAKKYIRTLTLGQDYFEQYKSYPASVDMTVKWLAKIQIYTLEFP